MNSNKNVIISLFLLITISRVYVWVSLYNNLNNSEQMKRAIEFINSVFGLFKNLDGEFILLRRALFAYNTQCSLKRENFLYNSFCYYLK